MPLDETPTTGETTHIADHAALRTAYLARGANRTLTDLTASSTREQHAAVHNILHAEHNALGAATTLPTNVSVSTTSGHLAHHAALHKAQNLRDTPAPTPGQLTRLPMQPGAIYYGSLTGPTNTQYRQPGALVITSRGNFGHSNMVAAAAAGAHVIGYFDAIVWAVFGSSDVTGRLLNSSVYGAAVPKWPGPVNANGTGDLADFRPGSVMHQPSSTNASWTKLEAVLESIVAENPHLSGFFADDLGSRSWFPNFNWDAFGTQNQADYRAGAILVLQAFRRVCNRHGMFLLVNGTWAGGTLASNGGGYPTIGTHGCSLADGGVWEHHVAPDSFSNGYFGSTQWGSASPITGAGKAFHLTIGEDNESPTAWANTGVYAWFVQKTDYTLTPMAPWGSFHVTGLPTSSGAPVTPPTSGIQYQASGTTLVVDPSTTWTLPVPAGAASGDILVLAANTGGDHTISSWPSTSHTLGSFQWDPGDPKVSVAAYVVPASPPANITVTFSAAQVGHLSWMRLSGALTSATPLDVAAMKTNSSGAPDNGVQTMPSVTTTGPDRYIIGGTLMGGGGFTWTGPTGWAGSVQSTGTPSSLLAAKGTQAAAGASGTASATPSTLSWGIGWTVALKKA